MLRKCLMILVVGLISRPAILNAQDSLSVWKIEYEYIGKSAANTLAPAEQFGKMAKYGRAILYYSDSVYRVQYSAKQYEIGDHYAPRRYSIDGDVAREGLSAAQQMPDMYYLPNEDFPKFLWEKDYEIRKAGNVKVMGIDAERLVVRPLLDGLDQVYEVYVSDSIPKVSWYPFTFLGRLSSGFLGMFKLNAKGKQVEGIKAAGVSQVKVPVEFFRVPKGMKIEKMVAPPKLNN